MFAILNLKRLPFVVLLKNLNCPENSEKDIRK